MIVVGILGYQALTKNWLETGFMALLPKSEQQPDIAKAIQKHNEHNNKKVIWLVGAATSQEAISQARQLKQQIEKSQLFGKITLEFPQQQVIKNYQQLFSYRYQLLDSKSKIILMTNPEQLMFQNIEWLNAPFGQMQTLNFEHDPTLLFSRFFSSQNPIKLNLEQGIVILPDKNQVFALLLTELESEQLPLDKLEDLLDLVNHTTEQLKASHGELLVTGMPLFTAHGSQSAQQEISTVGVGSSVGIMILLLTTFRSVRPLLLSALAIGSGLFAALIISILFLGKIHILTLVFGASLIGVADDYAQHFLCDSFGEKDWNPSDSLRFIFPSLSFGLLSTLLSYAGLSFSPFPGLQEVALFSAIGLVFAWLTVVLLFPLLLTGFTFNHEPEILKLAIFWERDLSGWIFKNRLLIGFVLIIFIVSGLSKLTPQDDIRLLQSAPVKLLQIAEKIKKLLPITRDNQFFLVSGKNQVTWHQNEQTLLNRLYGLKQQKMLTNYEGVSNYWMTENQQRENYQILKQSLYDSGLLKRYMLELGFDKTAVKSEQQKFAEAENNILSFSEWLASTDESKQQLWLGCDSGSCQSTISLTGITDIEKLKILQELPGVVFVNQVEQLSELFARYRMKASALLAVTASLVLVIFGLRFGWRNAFGIMSIPVIALATSLAALSWFNQLFSLFNLFALLLVLGIGVDYGLYFFMAGNRRVSTSLGVILSALTTLLAFGLLATSSTEIVHAFGFTITIGIVAALMSAPLVGRFSNPITFVKSD
jgi:predicted exporter